MCVFFLKGFEKTWFDGKVKGHWAMTISHWDGSKGPVDDLQALNFAPVFVYEFKMFSAGIRPYIDYSPGLLFMLVRPRLETTILVFICNLIIALV